MDQKVETGLKKKRTSKEKGMNVKKLNSKNGEKTT
jgi:hypothetical protein